MTSTFTTEFGHEYEQERGQWLRRRFLWYSGVIVGFYCLALLIALPGLWILSTSSIENAAEGYTRSGIQLSGISISPSQDTDDDGPQLDSQTILELVGPEAIRKSQITSVSLAIVATAIVLLLYVLAFLRVKRGISNRDDLLRLVSQLIILSGVIGIISSILNVELIQWTAPELYRLVRSEGAGSVIGTQTLSGILATHFIASLFLPWTPRESLRPIIPLAIIGLAVTAFYSLDRPFFIPLVAVLMFLAATPGLLVSWLRTSRFRSKFHIKMVTRRYGEIRSELDAARQIHDAMFPAPVEDGPVRMRYAYEPMRQIGGDYLFAHRVPSTTGSEGGLLVVLIDVTGHGITAALTVNRLQGEIERQVSLDPMASPGKVLSGLNDYLHHTLARHSVYATSLVMRFDPAKQAVTWASAGHPPAFLRAVDGTVRHMESTTIVLGATKGEHFESVEESLPFGPGDTVLAYTDGVTEAKNEQGRMLRIEGLEKFLAAHRNRTGIEEDTPRLLLNYVNDFRVGPPQDDSLIVEIYRPLR